MGSREKKNLSLGNVKFKVEIMYFNDHISQFKANVSLERLAV